MVQNTRRGFMKQAAMGAAALLAYSPSRVLGANDRVRLGMIGVGGRGQDLLKQVLQLPDAQLVAVADIYSRRRDEAKQMAPGIQTLDDYRRLLAMKDIDGVIVATPRLSSLRAFPGRTCGRERPVLRKDHDLVHRGGGAVFGRRHPI